MDTTRRGFLKGATLAACASAGGCRSMFTGAASDFDDSLSVLISDLHVGGSEPRYAYTQTKLRETVAAILAMDPLPRHVVCFGDVALTYGLRCDYSVSKPILQPLVDAGIDLQMTLGNHDRRAAFFEAWQDFASRSPNAGRADSVVRLRDADLLLLDALKGADDRGERDMGPVEGALTEAQVAFVKSWAAKATRPFFVGSHQFLDLTAPGFSAPAYLLGDGVDGNPLAAGWIYGHDHEWGPSFRVSSWRRQTILPILALPSAGLWGDIGYVTFRTSPDGAVARLVQNDFYFNSPRPADKRPRAWDVRLADNRAGKFTRFTFDSKK